MDRQRQDINRPSASDLGGSLSLFPLRVFTYSYPKWETKNIDQYISENHFCFMMTVQFCDNTIFLEYRLAIERTQTKGKNWGGIYILMQEFMTREQ